MQYESMSKPNNYIMQKAVIILRDYGNQIFDGFCAEHDFSFCDINRCIAKCKISYDRGDLQEYQLPGNLKQARWNHYTAVCGYSQQKARQLLKMIDEAYKNQ